MKKIILIALSIVLSVSSRAQVIYFEDFDGTDGVTFGGPGTYNFSPGWRLRNVDNRVPEGSVAYVNEAWERREDFKFNVNDSCAFSTSWHNPAGAADDFMWTPLIGSLPAFSELSWNAVSYDAAFPDSYEVRVMVVGDGPPGGGTGVMGNQVTNSTLLLSVPQENVNWTSRTVSLAAYAGQMAYIGFRNISNDKFLLLIDDIKVEVNITFDAQVLNAIRNPYSMIPHSQAANIPLGASIRNNGRQSLTNVNLMARIYNSSGGLVHTQSGTAIAALTSGATTDFTIPPWTPPAADNYLVKYFPVTTETDQLPINDTISNPLIITDSVYARDDGGIIMNLGIGTGNGYMGQAFTTQSAVELGSVTVAFNRGYAGRPYGLVVWNTTGAGVPNNIVAATDTLVYPDDGFLLDTIPIHGGRVLLPPGEYVVTAIEFDSTLALAMTNDIFSLGKNWVSWNAQPWTNVEAFGASFMKAFYMRMNINEAAVLPVKVLSFTGAPAPEGNKLEWQVVEQQDILRYEVERSMDGRNYDIVGSVAANNQSSFTYRFIDPVRRTASVFYRLKIIEANKINYSQIIHIRPGVANDVVLFPNPVRSMATLEGRDATLLNTKIALMTMDGRELNQMIVSQLPFSFDMNRLPGGVYLLRLEDGSVLKLVKE